MNVRLIAFASLVLTGLNASAAEMPELPKPVASFGAAAWDGYLYVYGGHVGKTHSYDTESVVGTFHRLKIDGGTHWEELPGGPRAQGMNLVSHEGKIYRIGGMQPRNKPGDPADNHSLAECSRYDVKTGKWETLPALPSGRSSHDVVVVGNKLVVVGGWQMKGKGEKSVWHETVQILDLSAKDLKWESAPQPFQRRALTAAAIGNKVYVLGGLGADGKPTDIFDVETKKWSQGPALPLEGKKAMAFSPSAATVGNRIVVNTTAGPFYRLTADGSGWEKVGAAESPRMVARLVATGERSVLLVGGASMGEGTVRTIEAVKLAEKGEPVKPAAPVEKK